MRPFIATNYLIAAILPMVAMIVAPLVARAEEADATNSEFANWSEGKIPTPLPLWVGKIPLYPLEQPPAEVTNDKGTITNVSKPTISVYLPSEDRGNGMAMIVCPGGGYGALDWRTHVVYAAQALCPQGVTVIGLKYRTRPPYKGPNEAIQAVTLQDAKRAIRTVRHQAGNWRLDSHKIGIAGYSAGANLAMNLAAHFDDGDGAESDPIERESSRPDFAIGLATWHWRQKASPFRFGKNTPPVFLVHATNDGITGGAPIELPRAIKSDLEKLGVPVRMEVFNEGGHGVGNLIPQRVKNGFPPAKWPELFLNWFGTLPKPVSKT